MFSSCQSTNVNTLLHAGVRAIDFRMHLSQKDNKLHDSHGGRGPRVEGSLSDIARYAQQHPSEIVFVYFQMQWWPLTIFHEVANIAVVHSQATNISS